MIHSLDSFELALALNERLQRENKTMRALIQVNSSGEESKSGLKPDEFLDVYAQITAQCPTLKLQGIMSIGAHTTDSKIVQKSFEITRTLFDKIPNATVCSMGMSGDFELAIACGSNLVRLGSILFSK
jgi:pyridoxal phosphate enzyme (YggS family)